MSKRTYYRGPDAMVTDDLFVWCPPGHPATNYVLRDLRNIGLVRTGVDGRTFAPALIAGAVSLAVASGTLLEPPAAYAVAALAIALPAALAGAAWRTLSRRWELHATYRGVEVVLYSSTDTRVFNQVTRALRRAMENVRPPRSGLDLAAA